MFVSVTPSEAIANEGFNYRDLYSNFVILAPIALFSVFCSIKERSWSVESIAFVICLCAILVAFAGAYIGVVSTYYLSKLYFLMWLLTYVCAAQGITRLLNESNGKALICSYCLVWCCIALSAVSGLGQRLFDKDTNLNPTPLKSWSYLDIYQFNYAELKSLAYYDQSKLELYSEAQVIESETGSSVPFVGGIEDFFWYIPITNQMIIADYNPWTEDEDTSYEDSYEALLAEADYLVLVPTEDNTDYFSEELLDDAEVLFENESGCLVKVKH